MLEDRVTSIHCLGTARLTLPLWLSCLLGGNELAWKGSLLWSLLRHVHLIPEAPWWSQHLLYASKCQVSEVVRGDWLAVRFLLSSTDSYRNPAESFHSGGFRWVSVLALMQAKIGKCILVEWRPEFTQECGNRNWLEQNPVRIFYSILWLPYTGIPGQAQTMAMPINVVLYNSSEVWHQSHALWCMWHSQIIETVPLGMLHPMYPSTCSHEHVDNNVLISFNIFL